MIMSRCRRALPVLVAAAVASLPSGVSAAAAAPLPLHGLATAAADVDADHPWKPVFIDRFDGGRIDPAKWGVYTGGQRRASNVIVSNGTLKLRTMRTSSGWTAAGVTSARSLHSRYGKYVIRARFERGQGVRAVGLLWPTGGTWPPEVDFYEVAGDNPQRDTNLTAHHYVQDGQHRITQKAVHADYTEWHRVGVIWSPGSLTYLLDGEPVGRLEQHVPQRDMWLGMQTATGTGEGAPTASSPSAVDFEVDWVHVFKPRY